MKDIEKIGSLARLRKLAASCPNDKFYIGTRKVLFSVRRRPDGFAVAACKKLHPGPGGAILMMEDIGDWAEEIDLRSAQFMTDERLWNP